MHFVPLVRVHEISAAERVFILIEVPIVHLSNVFLTNPAVNMLAHWTVYVVAPADFERASIALGTESIVLLGLEKYKAHLARCITCAVVACLPTLEACYLATFTDSLTLTTARLFDSVGTLRLGAPLESPVL